MTQQYTCPFCKKNYTRITISEHYGCGVEPLSTENGGSIVEMTRLISNIDSVIENLAAFNDVRKDAFLKANEMQVKVDESPQFTEKEIEAAKAVNAEPLEEIEQPEILFTKEITLEEAKEFYPEKPEQTVETKTRAVKSVSVDFSIPSPDIGVKYGEDFIFTNNGLVESTPIEEPKPAPKKRGRKPKAK